MAAYLLRRLAWLVPTVLGITLITFFMIRLAPGDPVSLKARADQGIQNEGVAQTIVDETKALYGFDQPLATQYLNWLRRVITFDFGRSYFDHQPVWRKIAHALPITLILNLLAVVLVYGFSIVIGMTSALRPNGWWDHLTQSITFFLYALPSFWVATLLIIYLGGGDYLDWFPIQGYVSDGAAGLPWYRWLLNVLWHLVLPVFCLAYGGMAFLSRFMRATLLEVLHQDYMKLARAKGLTRWEAVWRHGLPNAAIPLITLTGTLLPALLGGSVIIEQIFSIPGMGKLAFSAVMARDYPVVMALATVNALLTMVSLLATDCVYALIDPRISFQGRR